MAVVLFPVETVADFAGVTLVVFAGLVTVLVLAVIGFVLTPVCALLTPANSNSATTGTMIFFILIIFFVVKN
jgi:hypothetical protein